MVDCQDASDEVQCGTCDFEDDRCGWEDVSDEYYRWNREDRTALTDLNGPQGDADGNSFGM